MAADRRSDRQAAIDRYSSHVDADDDDDVAASNAISN